VGWGGVGGCNKILNPLERQLVACKCRSWSCTGVSLHARVPTLDVFSTSGHLLVNLGFWIF